MCVIIIMINNVTNVWIMRNEKPNINEYVCD